MHKKIINFKMYKKMKIKSKTLSKQEYIRK